jgi:hypothetical protein
MVEDLNALRNVEVAGGARADVVVAALVKQRRKPADFQLQSDDFQELGVLQQQEEARFRLDEVRILVALADGGDVDAVAADFACERREIFGGGDDFQFVGGEGVRRECE